MDEVEIVSHAIIMVLGFFGMSLVLGAILGLIEIVKPINREPRDASEEIQQGSTAVGEDHMCPSASSSKEQADRSQISTERIQTFFPPNATAKEMEETILEALTAYFNKKEV